MMMAFGIMSFGIAIICIAIFSYNWGKSIGQAQACSVLRDLRDSQQSIIRRIETRCKDSRLQMELEDLYTETVNALETVRERL